MNLVKNKTQLALIFMLMAFIAFLLSALFGFYTPHSSLSVLLNFRYLLFLILLLVFIFSHSFYLFRRNIKWVPACVLFGVVYSLTSFLGFVAFVEMVTHIQYQSLVAVFTFCSIMLSVFFSYVFFGLAAKDFYRRPKNLSAEVFIGSTLKKYVPFFINIMVVLGLIFFCTILLGFTFFLDFSFLLIATVLISILGGVLFSALLCVICYTHFS